MPCVPSQTRWLLMRCSSAMQHADVAHPLRDLEAEQLLHRHAERHAVGLRAQVVHPLDERDHLLPLLLLGGLLDAGVEVADGRRRREHRLAVELEHQPQHAVRAGVLRPHVDGHRFGADLGHQKWSVARLARSNAFSTMSQITCSNVRCTSCTRAVIVGRHVDVNRRRPPDCPAVARRSARSVCMPERARRLERRPRRSATRRWC